MSFVKIVSLVSSTALVFTSGLLIRQEYHQRNSKKKCYRMSFWGENVKEETKEIVTQNRKLLVSAIKNFYEMKPVDSSSVSGLFNDDVMFENRYITCFGKNNLFKGFQLFSEYWSESNDVKRFDVFHSENCIHILCERHLNKFTLSEVPLNSIITITLNREGDCEKVSSIVEEFDEKPVLDPQSTTFGNVHRCSRWMYFKAHLIASNIRKSAISFVYPSSTLDKETLSLLSSPASSGSKND